MNKYQPHVYVIPEDDRDRQIANGFLLPHLIDHRRIQVMEPPGGWMHVLKTFLDEYVPILRRSEYAHVVMVIDFDDQYPQRKARFDESIPDDIKDRVYVIGAQSNPESLRQNLDMTYERIGAVLAQDCDDDTMAFWNHQDIKHNEPERRRMYEAVRPFLFQNQQA